MVVVSYGASVVDKKCCGDCRNLCGCAGAGAEVTRKSEDALAWALGIHGLPVSLFSGCTSACDGIAALGKEQNCQKLPHPTSQHLGLAAPTIGSSRYPAKFCPLL
eukprot:2954235-Amphidinium_carterae.1